MVQVVVPSREDVPEYQALKAEVEQLVGEINGEFTRPGWVPVQYIYRSLDETELLAYYRMADICLLTPLKDGMNLVSKEYCASKVAQDGVLILSEFAGSAAQLRRGALLVNPHDVEGTADAIYRAFRMPRRERRTRMRHVRSVIEQADIFWWTDAFLNAAIRKQLAAFPLVEHFLPVNESERSEVIV
jgi:trehalose 6-phosphate synthase